jgi:hypothetical protein
LVGRASRKETLGKPRCRYYYMDLKEIGYEDVN